jgi:hypothetical protein
MNEAVMRSSYRGSNALARSAWLTYETDTRDASATDALRTLTAEDVMRRHKFN